MSPTAEQPADQPSAIPTAGSATGPRIGLVVGAGGPTGAPFIHEALDEIERRTGWNAAAATTVVGTSAGGFVAAVIGPEPRICSPAELEGLLGLANGHRFTASSADRIATTVRALGGLVVAALTPGWRPRAQYRVPPPPYHPGAAAVTVRRGRGGRQVHNLAEATDPAAVIRGSAAVPFLTGPAEIDGRDHIDGAVHSAANADAVDQVSHDLLVVIAPMVTTTGGSPLSRLHRAQLRVQLQPWLRAAKPVLVVLPTDSDRRNRRDRSAFELAGRNAASALAADR